MGEEVKDGDLVPGGGSVGQVFLDGIVDDYNIGPFAGGRTANRGRDAITGTIIFEPVLLILIWS